MKISEKFIKENQDKTLKEVFPELFEVKLKVGEWYKTTHEIGNCLFCYTGGFDNNNNPLGYGFSSDDEFFPEEKKCGWGFKECNPRKATIKEIKQALIKEAEKKWFKEGVYIDRNHISKSIGIAKIDKKTYPKDPLFYFSLQEDYLEYLGFVVYSKGQWAKIIPSLTKKEAEEKLKCKIVD